jgi:hypothetical protein
LFGKALERDAALKKILLALVPLMLLVPLSVAFATPVQEFSFQLTGVKSDGRFTVVFTSRTFDTSGGIPPVVKENYLRLPAGAKLQPAILKKRYFCDGQQLLKTLQANPDPKYSFIKMVRNLDLLAAKLKSAADRKARANVLVCKRSLVGQGTVKVDARPLLDPLIPANIFLYFSKGTIPGALASFSILGVPDESDPVVRNNPTVRNTRVVVAANFINDPTPDGLYGYKLVLPSGPIGGINISIAEVNVTTKGLAITKKKTTCLKHRHGKCVKKKVKKTTLFWFTRPTCPQSGKLNFQAFYGYDDPTPDITKTVELPCPKFK